MQKRRRLKQTVSLTDRLAQFAKAAGEKASGLPPGRARDELLRKVSQAETALRFEVGAAPEKALLAHPADDDRSHQRGTHGST